MTLIERARKGNVPSEARHIARDEHVSAEYVRAGIAQGIIVAPLNNRNKGKRRIVGIGQGLCTKVNVNLGGSPYKMDCALEKKKLALAIKHKADAVMDLSVGKNAAPIRRMVCATSSIPVGTVPIYDVMSKNTDVETITVDDMFDVIYAQALEGVDFMTLHCGVTKRIVEKLSESKYRRVTGIVSRGGAIMAEWILRTKKENPLFEHFDRLLDIAHTFDITLSLGDGLRPGCLDDATDWAQLRELKLLGELTKRAWAKGVQVMVEGPGHIPLHEVQKNIALQKKYCHGAPFYVLGPLVTDIAPGYDHITSAIGGALAAWAGANFLCYVTPAEHLHLPDENDVVDGLIAARIAGHAADIAHGIPRAKDWDSRMAHARKKLDWDTQCALSINPTVFKKRFHASGKKQGECTMCGEFCSMKRMNGLVM